MLVAIVVAAATLIAAFVASYQKQLQTEETFSHDQSLESIRVLGLTTSVTGGAYSTFGFTLASKYVNPSVILGISINNVPLKSFRWHDVSSSANGWFVLGQNLNLSPFEEVAVSLDLDPANTTFSFLNNNSVPQPNHYLKFDVYTALQNDFTQVYLPPTSLAVVSEINPSGNNPITLLDGSMSFQPGGNASIVDWTWTINGGNLSSVSGSISTPAGGDVGSPVAGNGTASFSVPTWFAYGTGDSVAFAAGEPTTSAGAGCALSGVTLTPTAESVAGSTLTVQYTYSATASGSGCGANVTTQVTPHGVNLNVLPLSAAGEDYEISPALIPIATSYLVTLAVTNSVGLQGTVSVEYTPPA